MKSKIIKHLTEFLISSSIKSKIRKLINIGPISNLYLNQDFKKLIINHYNLSSLKLLRKEIKTITIHFHWEKKTIKIKTATHLVHGKTNLNQRTHSQLLTKYFQVNWARPLCLTKNTALDKVEMIQNHSNNALLVKKEQKLLSKTHYPKWNLLYQNIWEM